MGGTGCGGQLPVQSQTPENNQIETFIEEKHYMYKHMSALRIILKLVISGLTSIILIVLGNILSLLF